MGLIRDHLLPQPSSFVRKKEFKLEGTLGVGAFGKVVRATWKKAPPPGPSVREVALKIIPKELVKGNEEQVFDEMQVLKDLDHPNIVKVFDHFESRDKHYIVFELATGGELFDRILSKGRFTEADAIEALKQVLEAVTYLHSHDVVHRDLKPENILYRTKEEHSGLVLCDFGVARHLEPDHEFVATAAGSLGYAAPEVLLGKEHGKPVDLWSIGIITYVLLCGYTPFRSDDPKELVRETARGRIEFHAPYWNNVSEEARNFIKELVVVDPHKRLTAEEALHHPWIESGGTHVEHDLHPVISRHMTSSAERWRKATRTISAAKRFQSYGSASSGGFADPSANSSPAQTPGAKETQEGEGSDDEGYYQTADEADEADTSKHVHGHIARSDDPQSGAFGNPVHGPEDGVPNGHAGYSSADKGEVDGLSKKTANLEI
ncbi:Calmodulin-dependent protein kinase cmk2 [Naganishia albida]|nr:Calmodulin-dependent protein kinase cmk2 [Naganishia albida]